MNTAFRFYGKQPYPQIEREALRAQAKYNLNDLQLSMLLEIHDFFKRVAVYALHVADLEIVHYKPMKDGVKEVASRERMPIKTSSFFSVYNKCSDGEKHFNDVTGHKFFERFSDKVLSESFTSSDYLAHGVIEPSERSAAMIVEYQS